MRCESDSDSASMPKGLSARTQPAARSAPQQRHARSDISAAAFADDEARGEQQGPAGERRMGETLADGLKSRDSDVAAGLCHRGQRNGQQAGRGRGER